MDMQKTALLASLSQTISDYSANQSISMTPDHIEKWLSQFDREDQPIILHEMDFIMKRYYFSRKRTKHCVQSFIQTLIGSEKPEEILPHIKFLHTHQSGNSQQAMLDLVDEILLEKYNLTLADSDTKNIKNYVYMDDAIYTGNKIRYDNVLQSTHSSLVTSYNTLTIYVIASHSFGARYASNHIKSSYYKFSAKLYTSFTIEDARISRPHIEVAWPEYIENNALIDAYSSCLSTSSGRKLANSQIFRYATNTFQERLFSSVHARKVVEQAFLVKGIELIQNNASKAPSIRPLGFMKLASLGFGTFFVTYRNIANNCPLVLWWGNPNYSANHPLGKWYPLFYRQTNEDGIL